MRPSFIRLLLISLLFLSFTACGRRPAQFPSLIPTPTLTLPSSAGSPAPERPKEPLEHPLSIAASPVVPERRLLSLDYPAFVRLGDAERVYLTLEVDKQGNITPTARAGDNIVQGQIIEIPNVYDTHHLWVEARLDLAGVVVKPSDIVSETMFPGQTITFFWSIQPQAVGNYKGTVWLYLRFVPKDGGLESRRAISAQLIEIEVVTFYGLKADSARWLGLVGTTLSAAAGFPFFEDIVRWLFSRRKKRR